jgi:hypothetical protein
VTINLRYAVALLAALQVGGCSEHPGMTCENPPGVTETCALKPGVDFHGFRLGMPEDAAFDHACANFRDLNLTLPHFTEPARVPFGDTQLYNDFGKLRCDQKAYAMQLPWWDFKAWTGFCSHSDVHEHLYLRFEGAKLTSLRTTCGGI